jgi:Protein of unknown function (DUF3887)/Protein of unknown function (DUF4019)
MTHWAKGQQMKYATLLIAVALAACSTPLAISTEADVVQFHRLLEAEDYAAIWKNTSEDMRRASTEADLSKIFSAINRKLGKVVETKQIGWRTNRTTNGTFAEVQLETRFEKGKGVESFVFRQVDGKLLLAGYNINSNDMMLN